VTVGPVYTKDKIMKTQKFVVYSSLGKRDVEDLSKDTHYSEMSITSSKFGGTTHLNCWVKDSKGRKLGMVIHEDSMIEIMKFLVDAITEREEINE
jgi:hypothetical protein